MADEKKPSPAAVFLSQHGEKVGLGVAAAALVGYLILGVLMARQDNVSVKVQQDANKLKTLMGGTSDKCAPPAREGIKTKALEAYNKVTAAGPGDAWAMTYATKFKIDADVEQVTRVQVKMAMAPISLSYDVTVDGVVLSWTVGRLTDTTGQQEVKPQYFIVYKKASKNGTLQEVARLKGDPKDPKKPALMTWTDRGVSAKTYYWYAVRGASADKKWTDANKSELAKEYSNEVNPRTMGIYVFKFQSPIPGRDNEPAKVYIGIEKHDAQFQLVKISHFHKVGEQIGWWEEGGQLTSKHEVPLPGGKGAEIDFDTKCTLKAIEEFKGTLERIRCVDLYGEGGAVVGCKQVKEPIPFRSVVVVYTDDEGKEQKWWEKDPKAQDVLCEAHGGRPSTGASPEELAQRKNNAAQKLLADADKAFEEAKTFQSDDDDRKARKWKYAMDKYDELLKKYSDTEAFKQKKVHIEGRQKECKQKFDRFSK